MLITTNATAPSHYRTISRAPDDALRISKLTDEMWNQISACLPESKPQPRGGRRRAPDRVCFEGILWLIWTDAPWNALPDTYGSASTCRRRFKEWHHDGRFIKMWSV
jgi:transposase